jgi:hypothetical protein
MLDITLDYSKEASVLASELHDKVPTYYAQHDPYTLGFR